jgi:dihydroneopterin aldolase
MDHIQLRGLRAVGTHGVLPEERQRAQPFEVDIDIEADLSEAGRSDALADTVDYAAIADLVAAEITGCHADLLEHLADRIAGRVLATAGTRVTSVSVTVRKLRPPLPVDLSSVSVSVTRP